MNIIISLGGFLLFGRRAIAGVTGASAADRNRLGEGFFLLLKCIILQGDVPGGLLVDVGIVVRGMDDATSSLGGCGAGTLHMVVYSERVG